MLRMTSLQVGAGVRADITWINMRCVCVGERSECGLSVAGHEMVSWMLNKSKKRIRLYKRWDTGVSLLSDWWWYEYAKGVEEGMWKRWKMCEGTLWRISGVDDDNGSGWTSGNAVVPENCVCVCVLVVVHMWVIKVFLAIWDIQYYKKKKIGIR